MAAAMAAAAVRMPPSCHSGGLPGTARWRYGVNDSTTGRMQTAGTTHGRRPAMTSSTTRAVARYIVAMLAILTALIAAGIGGVAAVAVLTGSTSRPEVRTVGKGGLRLCRTPGKALQ